VAGTPQRAARGGRSTTDRLREIEEVLRIDVTLECGEP
jgi:hypothetical protein